jgi:hypothetical protein
MLRRRQLRGVRSSGAITFLRHSEMAKERWGAAKGSNARHQCDTRNEIKEAGLIRKLRGRFGTAVRAPEKDATASFGRTMEPPDEAAVVEFESATGSNR